MSRVIIVFVLLGLAALALGAANTTKPPIEPEAESEFKKWREEHKRSYQDGKEEERRKRIFRDNWKRLKQIDEDGDDDKPYKLKINKFADLTAEEFAAQYLGTKPKVMREDAVVLLATTTLPTSIDWRTKNAVTPIRNQGSCGSCWSFSAVAALEGLYAIKYGILKQFSEQQLIDCAGSYGNYACNGGLMANAFKYTRDYGVQAASTYTLYRGAQLSCTFNSSKVVFKNTGYVAVTKNDNVQLAAAVAARPVSVAVQADASVFQFYSSGIIDSTACGTSVNHGVTIVGYGTASGKNYWIVKNSWGTGWGEAGYVRIAKSASTANTGVCGIATMASYPVA